jgi:polyhydroxybutyrate depolymerase
VPIVVSLHGFAANPDGQRANARWEVLAAEQGFLVVYPQGSSFPLRWNVGPQARLDSVDDVRFMLDILDDLSAWPTIDPRRVYVSGFSNGGHMTHLLACALADRIAAVGIVEGLGADGPQGCHPVRPVPVMGYFSAIDPRARPLGIPDWLTDIAFNVSIEAAAAGPASPEAWAADRAKRNACRQPALSEPLPAGITQQRYTSWAQDAEVILVSIPGMGHAWPGGPSLPFLGESTAAIDAARLLWEFFAQHPLPPGE